MKKLEEELGEKIDEKDLKTILFDGGKNKYRSTCLIMFRMLITKQDMLMLM